MNKEPMFNIAERAPVWLAGILIVIYAAILYLPNILTSAAVNFMILKPLGTFGRSNFDQAFSLLGHGFLHGSWSHVLMNSAMMIVFGVATIRGAKLLAASQGMPAKGEAKFLLVFLIGIIAGGLAQWLYWSVINIVQSGANVGALGASGGASALFATAAWAIGGKDKLIAFGIGWMFINLIIVLAESIIGISIAWAAHLGGYIGGALIAPFWIRANSAGLSFTK